MRFNSLVIAKILSQKDVKIETFDDDDYLPRE